MKRQPILTPGKAALLMLGIGTISLIGLPGVAGSGAPAGPLAGLLLDADGERVADCRVALFDGESLALVEWTSSDESGRFAFHQAPATFHAFASPTPELGLVGSWSLDRTYERYAELELVLRPGHEVALAVVDESGDPVAEAEVRVYDARAETVVVARCTTDARGRARVLAPARAHFGVMGRSPDGAPDLVPAWAFDQEIAVDGRTIELTLPPAEGLAGRVADREGNPLEGIVVSAWEHRDGSWQWNGYRRSDRFGEFLLPGSSAGAWVRAVDLAQRWLPRHEKLTARDYTSHELVLDPGLPLQIHCVSSRDAGSPSRIWVWSERHQAWSWGSRTDEEGVLDARVSERHSIVAEPLDGPDGAAQTLDRTYAAPGIHLTSPAD